MFQGLQRLKAGIDSRIAEEQARQRSLASPTASRYNSNSAAGKPGSNTSPVRPARKPKPKDEDASVKGPEPADFEAVFALNDDSEAPSRVNTPSVEEKALSAEMADNGIALESSTPVEGTEKTAEIAPRSSTELPASVRTKLRRADKIEATYQELLSSYKIAHKRASLVEPFEKALRENTPLTTIKDPDGLIEYLNQLNLKGDMVMDELKRITGDRDAYRKRLEAAEVQIAKLQSEGTDVQSTTPIGPVEQADASSIDIPSASIRSPGSSVRQLFSPLLQSEPFPSQEGAGEELFSCDEEIPKLQVTVKDKTAEVERLQKLVTSLQDELANIKESSAAVAANLEKANEEMKDVMEASASAQVEKEVALQSVVEWTAKLETSEKKISMLEANLKLQKKAVEERGADLEKQKTEYEGKLCASKTELSVIKDNYSKEIKTLTDITKDIESTNNNLEMQLKEAKSSQAVGIKQGQELTQQLPDGNLTRDELAVGSTLPPVDASISGATAATKKKSNKKKKKGTAGATAAKDVSAITDFKSKNFEPATISNDSLQLEITQLRKEIVDRGSQIEKLQSKRKTEATLREELEDMQDNLLSVGQEHVEAKDKIKELGAEKTKLLSRITQLEQEIQCNQTQYSSSQTTSAAEYEDLKLKTTTLQINLSAAQQLASSRYRDLTDLKEVLQKAQPELKNLRAENATLRTTKEELASKTLDLRRLEAREKDLKADIANFKKQATDSMDEIRMLNEKVVMEGNARAKAEDQARHAQRDLRKAEVDQTEMAAAHEKLKVDFTKVSEEAGRLRSRIGELEGQISTLTSEDKTLREEVALRSEQYENAQGLLASMRDQSAEMAMQLKEAKEVAESLEEELGDVQRLLSERTREGETMRRLLADVDGRAEARVREMEERMGSAVAERDRAEDEASRDARRRAREGDDLKGRIRDLEKEMKKIEGERDELERGAKDWKKRGEEVEADSKRNIAEAEELRTALSRLHDALEGSEKLARETETSRAELRRVLDEANARYEKLHKEYKSLQLRHASTRGSGESARGAGGRTASPAAGDGNEREKKDYVYLKTILLQFLEQKDKKIKTSLVKTVLGRLLLFDRKDQEKWIAAIAAM